MVIEFVDQSDASEEAFEIADELAACVQGDGIDTAITGILILLASICEDYMVCREAVVERFLNDFEIEREGN